ncbi:hypothetical protein [Nocardia sp. NPDC052566]|uniref:hypothetical protein n=1 Tax=Nocardia sp. NPDC052566 TaxID=3364330 RepID=UPI0037C6EC31
MIGSTAVTERTRRKAVRTAGPPLHDGEERAAEQDSSAAGKRAVNGGAAAGQETVELDAAPAKAVDMLVKADKPVEAVSKPVAAVSDSVKVDAPTVMIGKASDEEKAADAPAQADAPAGADDAKLAGRRWQRIAVAVAAAIVVLGAVIGAGASVYLVHTADNRAALREDYLQFGRQAAINMTTIRADSVQQDVDRVYAMSSGSFKTEFDQMMKDFIGFVQEAKVKSSGEATEAALESFDDRSARVLVANRMTVSNAGLDQPQQRVFRMRLTVTRDGDTMKLSGMEFVS